jgi:hypothetical protein
MPQIDFPIQGLDAQWPSKRWLDFLDGPAAGPPVGVWLGNADESASLYVGTYPRSRFDTQMVYRGDDPLREVAYSVTFKQINRILFQLGLRKDWRTGLLGALKQYADDQADEYPGWRTAQWDVTNSSTQAREQVEARVTALAGWESGFATMDGCYVTAQAYGMTLDNLRVKPVLDSSLYGFSMANAQMPLTVMTSVPGTEAPVQLPQDLAQMISSLTTVGAVNALGDFARRR